MQNLKKFFGAKFSAKLFFALVVFLLCLFYFKVLQQILCTKHGGIENIFAITDIDKLNLILETWRSSEVNCGYEKKQLALFYCVFDTFIFLPAYFFLFKNVIDFIVSLNKKFSSKEKGGLLNCSRGGVLILFSLSLADVFENFFGFLTIYNERIYVFTHMFNFAKTNLFVLLAFFVVVLALYCIGNIDKLRLLGCN